MGYWFATHDTRPRRLDAHLENAFGFGCAGGGSYRPYSIRWTRELRERTTLPEKMPCA